MNFITSRDNPWLKDLRRLAQDSTAYRKLGRVWLEGDHLCRAALTRGIQPEQGVFCESFWQTMPREWTQAAPSITVLPDALFAQVSALGSSAKMGFILTVPTTQVVQEHTPTVVLDRVQDAGNVGSILRSASAFGFKQVLAIKGTAALWSPKVLRAGMGAHFGLHLVEGLQLEDLQVLDMPWIATSSHQGPYLHTLQADTPLPMPCAWLLGHEGQGVSDELSQRAALQVRIAQPGGEESLNVACAAAICMYASAMTHLR